MRLPCLLVWSGLLFSCVPGRPFQAPGLTKGTAKAAQPLANDAIPEATAQTPPDDPEEEEKVAEPAIIGGAYLYCDAEEAVVGCRVGNLSDLDWVAAPKNSAVVNLADGSPANCAINLPIPGSPYQLVFNADRNLQSKVQLQVDITLPQGLLSMTSTVSPVSTQAITQRLGKGLALYATTGAAGDWPGIDRKTWNLWMPLKIPRVISNLGGDSSGPGPGAKGTAELSFDDTVCSYKAKDAKANEFTFVSCTRPWLPDQWVRSKALSLRVIGESPGPKGAIAAGVVLQTEP